MNKTALPIVRPWYAYMLAFTDGAIITAAELSATPLLAPAFGTSLLVWTSVIGVVLAALAVGYTVGGRLADRSDSLKPLLLWLIVGAVLIGLAPFLATWLFPHASLFGALTGSTSAGRLIATFVVMMLVLALPMVLLSMTSPYIISMLQRSEEKDRVGHTAGRVYTISTIGSLVGVFLGPLVLLPWLGTRLLFVSLAVVLLLLVIPGLIQSWGKRAATVAAVLVAVALSVPALSPVLARDDVIDETESFLQYIAVVETTEDVRQLRVNEGLGIQSSWDPASPYAANYTDIFALIPLLQAPPEDKQMRVLSLGLAGGSGPRALEAALDPSIDLQVDGVEIDPEMVRLAREHFALDAIESLTVHVADGRAFLHDVDTTYDFIYVDAFQNETTAPPELATQEFFRELREHLEPEGVVAMNVVTLTPDSELALGMQNTLASVFDRTYVGEVPGFHNKMLIATDGSFDPYEGNQYLETVPEELQELSRVVTTAQRVSYDPGERVFTDDDAPLHVLTLRMFANFIRTGGL